MILTGLAGVIFMVNITYFQAVRHISAIDCPLALCVGLRALLALGDKYTPARPIADVWLLAAYIHWAPRRSDHHRAGDATELATLSTSD